MSAVVPEPALPVMTKHGTRQLATRRNQCHRRAHRHRADGNLVTGRDHRGQTQHFQVLLTWRMPTFHSTQHAIAQVDEARVGAFNTIFKLSTLVLLATGMETKNEWFLHIFGGLLSFQSHTVSTGVNLAR